MDYGLGCALTKEKPVKDSVVIAEVQLLLAEKRTSLSVLRTGITVLILPLSVMSFLIATEKYYDFFNTLHFMIPLIVLNLALIVLGAYLIIRSLKRMHHNDLLIKQLTSTHTMLSELID